MNPHNVLRNTLFITILLYFTQGWLYPNGSVIAKMVLLIYLLISLYYTILFLFNKKKDSIGRILLLFIILNVIYWIFGDTIAVASDEFTGSSLNQIKNVLVALLSYFPFHYFAMRNMLSEKSLIKFYFLFFIVSVAIYFTSVQVSRELTGSENVVNNSAYVFLSLIPLSVIFWHKKLIFTIFFLLSFVFILFAAKRGPIVTMLFVVLTIFYYWRVSTKQKFKIRDFLSLLITFASIIYIGNYIIENNEFLLKRFQETLEGNSSGRDMIYASLFETWIQSESLLNLIFGYGFIASVGIAGNLAHNDWLEIVTSMGLLGIIVYAAFFIFMFKLLINMNQWTLQDKMMLTLVFIILSVKSIFSMGYSSIDTMPLMLSIANLTGKNWYLENMRKLNLAIVKKES